MKKVYLFIIGIFLTLIISGCGYRIGSLLPADIHTIAIPMFINKTSEAELSSLITNSVIQEFINDGTLRVTEYKDADTALNCEIIDYQREALSFNEADVTREYRLIITVKFVFKNLRRNEVLWENPRVIGETTFYVGSSLPDSERTALPDAAKDLAHHIVESVVEGGW